MLLLAFAAGTKVDSTADSLQRLWLKGEYSHCLEQCLKGGGHSLLAAASAYRLRRYEDCVSHADIAMEHAHGLEERYRATALKAQALAAAGDRNAAERALSLVADVRWQSSVSAKVKCEVDQAAALCAWIFTELDRCEATLARIEPCGDANLDARTSMLKAWLHAMRGDWRTQGSLLASALSDLLALDEPDVGLISNLAHGLAALLRERADRAGATVLRAAVQRNPWTLDMSFEHFQTLRLYAWTLALHGRHLPALNAMMRAKAAAPNQKYAVLSQFDTAYLSMIAGDVTTALATASHAASTAQEIDWNGHSQDELAALVVGAEVLGVHQPQVALVLLQRFVDLRATVPPTMLLTHDGRLDGLEAYARAVIAYGASKPNDVRRYATVAFDIFESLDFDWRAARAAILLYRIGSGERWRTAAEAKLRNYRNSFVASELRQIENSALDQRLTPRQREVAGLLRDGRSIDDIASELHCSRNTVRVHAQRIYRMLQVGSQRELLVRYRSSA